jgi:hypothetical protein
VGLSHAVGLHVTKAPESLLRTDSFESRAGICHSIVVSDLIRGRALWFGGRSGLRKA